MTRRTSGLALLLIGASLITGAGSASASNTRDAIFVANANYITIYPLDAKGDAEPAATIDGAATGLTSPQGIAVDSTGKIYVLNNYGGPGNRPSVVVFAPGSRGNVTPIAKIAGDETEMSSVKAIAVDRDGNIYVSNEGGPVSANLEGRSGITIYPAGSNGNVKPIATIRGAEVDPTKPCCDPCGNSTGIQNPFGIAVDAHGNLYVADHSSEYGPSVLIFSRGTRGNVRPISVISGPHAGLHGPAAIAVDSQGDIYVADDDTRTRRGSILLYRAGSSGDAPPIAAIERDGRMFSQIASDDGGNIYATAVVVELGDFASVSVFTRGATSPRATITGDATGLQDAAGIAVGPYFDALRSDASPQRPPRPRLPTQSDR